MPTGVVWAFPVEGEVLEHLLLFRGVETLWTIPVEIHFYVVFVALWWARSRDYGPVVMIGLALGGAATTAWLWHRGVTAQFLPFWLHLFLAGTAIALFRRRFEARLPAAGCGWLGWAAVAVFVVALPQLRHAIGLPILPDFIDPLSIGAPVLLFVATLLALGPTRWFGIVPLRYLGSISYGIYLFHYPVLMTVLRLYPGTGHGARIAEFAAVLLITLVISAISFRWFERPAQSWINGRRRVGRDTSLANPEMAEGL